MVARGRKAPDYREPPSAHPADAAAVASGDDAFDEVPDAGADPAAGESLVQRGDGPRRTTDAAHDGMPPAADATSDLVIDRREARVLPGQHGQRLDKVLAALAPEFSRSHVQHLIEGGRACVQGQPVQAPARRVRAGEAIALDLVPTEESRAFRPEPSLLAALAIVHEDEHLLVVDKPAGLVVHPAAGHWSGTLLNALLAHHAGAAALPRAGIVHRLDKDTSGLMLVGKSRRAVDALVRSIAAREVRREYLALAHGHWLRESPCEVERAVGRDPANRLRMAVLRDDQAGAKSARTTVSLQDTNPQASLVSCKLHTGRTHQIRVHMAWLGHPLVGDGLYGGRPLWGMQRQALHAAHLRLKHPVSGAPLAFDCPPPTDFQSATAQAGLHYNLDCRDD
ncbi:MAG: RluA family pseudouridine synthase [Hydrogenophaga sp.]|nr:RluA family pseudouridine synthase [Hydrogenophaga sp.]